MWCAVVVCIAAAAAAASAARYVDYPGVKMPAYGGDYEPRDAPRQPPDDYHGHSPDAPASLDYKYEEEPRIKTEKPAKDSEEPQVWRKPGRKQRGLQRQHDSGNIGGADKYEREEEEVPKFRSSHRYPKHRSRLKGDPPPHRDEDSPPPHSPPPQPRRPNKYSRDRKDDISNIDRKDYFHIDKDDFPDDKSKEFDDDVKFMNEATARRMSRRKPRERERHQKRKNESEDYEEDVEVDVADRRLKPDIDKEAETRRVRPVDMPRERFRPMLDDDDEEAPGAKVQPVPKLHKPKTYEDYDDYYDMKRVYNIKNKLPQLLRRTTVRVEVPTTSDDSYVDQMWTLRRKMQRPLPKDLVADVGLLPPTKIRYRKPTPTTIFTTTTATTSSTTTTVTTTTTTPEPTSKLTVTTSVATTTLNASQLSLAEKSRLSILKKDQRKEGLHIDPPTKKPPVLLQVTQHLPTVVMVEPPSSLAPWMRAQELVEDSPERIEKVKRLMRHKLVAEAKSIHDLTDKWDEMVCDYIDTSLLDSAALHTTQPSLHIVLATTLIISLYTLVFSV